ncbi:MAG: TlyA family RNA methyltransferase [Clostridia bacterium]|nr:TlyA family RNA methyltransferase [Clostridia bacterium]
MRLDNYLFVNKYFDSRTKSKQAIERGEVIVNGLLIDKPSYEINENIAHDIEIRAKETFVSLGGYKLSKALKDFSFSVKDKIAIDIGASTGGFTDCLLKNGTKKVFAVDLNDELLHSTLKNDDRVIPVIKNAKLLNKSDFSVTADIITADLSFISASIIIPVIKNLLDDKKHLILLIKPQFENDERIRFKNGIIKNAVYHENACKKIFQSAIENGLIPINFTTAPVSDKKNREFLVLCQKNSDIKPFNLDKYNF